MSGGMQIKLPPREAGEDICNADKEISYAWAGNEVWESKIPLKCWCLLTVNRSINYWTGFKHSVLTCAKAVLTKGVTAFHWKN